jgi:hypothetical protein
MSLKLSVRLLAAAVVLAAPAGAQTLQNVAGTPFYAPAIGNFSTLGNNLFGMLVTGRFSDGQVFSANWADLGSGLTGVNFGGRFSMTLGATSNTWDTAFTLTVFGTTNTLQSLTLNGAPGPVIFDRTFGGAVGTTQSQSGSDFTYVGTTDLWNTLVTYTNAVQMVGTTAAVGDIYETMQIEFRNALTGTATGRQVRFRQDVDNVITGGLLLPVPEPSTVLLTLAGLSMLALVSRRRQLIAAQARLG